jgi:hypothetical protein
MLMINTKPPIQMQRNIVTKIFPTSFLVGEILLRRAHSSQGTDTRRFESFAGTRRYSWVVEAGRKEWPPSRFISLLDGSSIQEYRGGSLGTYGC